MARTGWISALLLLIVAGCCKDEDPETGRRAAAGETTAAAPEETTDVDEAAAAEEDVEEEEADPGDVWPEKSIARLKDSLGQAENLLDEEALLSYIRTNHKRGALIKDYIDSVGAGKKPTVPLSDAVENMLNQEGYENSEQFDALEKRVLAANVTLLGMQGLETMLGEAASSPFMEPVVDGNAKALADRLAEFELKPTLADLKLVFKHRKALAAQPE